MKIYFDMNIYNRIFDDQTQMRIRFESMAIDILFELVENKEYDLMWSFILEYENFKQVRGKTSPSQRYQAPLQNSYK